jgi:hypothetical protein
MEIPRRAMSESSSPLGRALKMSTSFRGERPSPEAMSDLLDPTTGKMELSDKIELVDG